MPKHRKRRRNLTIVLALIVALGGGAAFWFLRKPNELIAVTVDRVARRDLTELVVANGRVQPATQVLISPEVAGEIIALPVVEGQTVKKGDLLVQIKPDNYKASRNSAEASYKFALGSVSQAEAEFAKADADLNRNVELSKSRLIPAKELQDMRTAFEIAKLRLANTKHQVDQARFALDKAEDDLSKTTITSPIDGTIIRLRSQLGERVLGTSFNMGTEIMTLADLDVMEARVDISEIDVVLIAPDQNVRLEVDAFKDRKFKGTVTAIANATRSSPFGPGGSSSSGSSQSLEAPKFEVRIRIDDKETFRPGMSVTAEIETRSRKAVLSVPIQAVTTRLPKTPAKPGEPLKPVEVVFALAGDRAVMVPVKTGISDNDYFEIVEGLAEGRQIISGGYKAVAKDLEDGKKVTTAAEKKDAK
ncbi:MAG: efflux RND transporter periplasmic adaptor subunit [Chthoniobacteraceae bacterium]